MKKANFIFLLLSLFYFSCNQNDLDIDVSQVDIDLTFSRFDVALFNIPADSIYYKVPELQRSYGEFFNIYNVNVIGVGLPEQKDYFSNLTEFFFYCDQMNLYDEVLLDFPVSDSYILPVLTDAFRHYKYYFASKELPSVYTCISGFGPSVFVGEGFIGISLDKYLGQYEAYSEMFENYLAIKMNKSMLPVDVMRLIGSTEFPYSSSTTTLMSKMIYEGRLQYFLDAMLPTISDSTKWGYSSAQWRWVKKYEKDVWDYLITKDLLFLTDLLNIKTFTGDAPFTTPFKNKSAPRAGNYIGYKIVQSFMKNNSDVSLPELMSMTDYMDIYNRSFYSP